MKVERRTRLSPEEFLRVYVAGKRPVIVTDAMDSWKARSLWTPEFFRKEFGSEPVQIYGDLFLLLKVAPLGEYMDESFGKQAAEAPRYVRWYARLTANDRVPWADKALERVRDHWSNPGFAPSHSTLLPFCPPSGKLDPARDPFLGKVMFVSAKGARTRLHRDPWCSSSLLCHFHGLKRFVLYAPDQEAFLSNERGVVDLAAPDRRNFPRFDEARASFDDVLAPGEIVFLPTGWFHHFDTLSDSISASWNFVHQIDAPAFFRYLASSPPKRELEVIAHLLFQAEGRRPLESGAVVETLLALKEALAAAERP